MSQPAIGLRPWPAAPVTGQVVHRRTEPATHAFSAPMHQVWLDPDHPEELFDLHPLWSSQRPAPVRFKRSDYLDGTDSPLGPQVRQALTPALGYRPEGPLRMLTQPRTWGWLFNPLTVYLAWPDEPAANGGPIAALLEVTNTPWKERHLYPVPLEAKGDELQARFAKELHVSPFLEKDLAYRLSISGTDESRMIDLTLNVEPSATDGDQPTGLDRSPLLHTRLRCQLHTPDRHTMGRPLRPSQMPTHRVSLGIHRQAFRLWRKGVPFVPHPARKK